KMLGLAPRESEDNSVVVTLGDLSCWEQLQVISRLLDRPVKPLLAPSSVVVAAINDAYQQRTGQAQEFIKTLDRDEVLDVIQQMSGREDLLDNAARAPVIKLVNLLLFEAVKSN